MTDESDLARQLQATHDDPPPDALLAAARAAYSWRTLDTDLCRPSYDSLLDDSLSSTRGGAGESRLLRFSGEDVALDVEVTIDGDGRGLVGQVTPPARAEITLRQGTGDELSVVTDDLGRFVLDGVRHGPVSIRCSLSVHGHRANTSLYTDWLLV
jgi:hypothetical protein